MRVRASHLTVTFESNPSPLTALHDVAFEVADGEFLTFVGSSGCGKTTLLRAVAGLVALSSGSVERVASPDDRSRQLLLVFQEDSVFPSASWSTRRAGSGA